MYKFENLIEEVKDLNTELKYGLDDIVGVTIEKGLIPTVANLTKTALDRFYLVKPETFIYNPRTHGVRLGMGYNKTYNTYITSWNNVAFRVKETAQNIVLPQYLWLYFCRPVWDRITNFLAWGSSTIVFAWKDFLNIDIDLPSIEKQREIVEEYETLSRRIRLNEQMIKKLEATAQALYRKMFVDGIDKENLPEGWRVGTIGEFGEVITGKTPSTLDEDNFGDYMPFLTIPDMHDGVFAIKTERGLSKKGVSSQANKTIPKNSVCVSCIGTSGLVVITTQDCQTNQQINSIVPHKHFTLEYIYQLCCGLELIIAEYGMSGAVLNNLNKSEFENLQVVVPSDEVIQLFHEHVSPVYSAIHLRKQENLKLTELQSLLLARMGQ